MSDDSDRTMMRRPALEDTGAEPMLHMLVIEAPGEAPRRLPLRQATLRLGRVADNDIVLPSV